MSENGVRFRDIRGLLEARSVAVVGASDREGNVGGTAIGHLLKFGYTGEIWPVHPSAETVAGLPAYRSVADLPGAADLAILAVPAARAVDLVAECGAAGIRNGVVWAGGFAESGPEGRALQDRLVEACAAVDFNLCGPNCLGLINTGTKLTATYSSGLFDFETMLTGTVSMVSQSGGITAASMALAARAGWGFRHVVSVGNEAVVSAADFIHHYANDDGVRVIAAYLEGVQDGAKLVAALREAHAAAKPVVILKGGRSKESAEAAKSHTAVLAGVDKVFSAVMRDCGVTLVGSLEELLDTASLFSSLRPEQLGAGGRIAITTTGGGGGVLATDQCVSRGLAVPRLSEATVGAAAAKLTPLAAVGNPTDLTPESFYQAKWRSQLPEALGAIAADEGVDGVLFLAQAMRHRAAEVVAAVEALRGATDKPVCVSWPLAPDEALRSLAELGIYAFPEHDRAARALGHLGRYSPAAGAASADVAEVPAAVGPVVAGWVVSEPAVVAEHRARPLLAAAGLPVVEGIHAHSVDEAAEFGFPLVLKGVTDEVTHRYAAGLVKLGVSGREELNTAWKSITTRAEADGVSLDGMLVQRMADGDTEFLVSAFTDDQFGVMVSVGVGGVLAEALDDVVLMRAPVSAVSAAEHIRGLKVFERAPKLTAGVDLPALGAFAANLAALASALPWRKFTLEINPVKADGSGVVALDALLIVEAV
ncbi:acetate--CoA ligase family protein [Amycolatopsis sp. DSM 110486]|uniref:acetate--CoA ligase family protein n=1 Tax=Amycolatopsis sp. DSM 110486 TaxID=2865832 RepID=UPI001C69B851|nr:acetate--CoA ligase family protein [Amycolatopsis sp. DSM 110486]QYN18104.1 acetate--CoA ligase family protein [Amycolatopsis sp. DSM 110486]